MTKKKQPKTDPKQPSLYGDVDEMYSLLSVQEAAMSEAVQSAEKRLTSAETHLDEMRSQLRNTQKMLKILARRRDELLPEKPPPPPKANAKEKPKKKRGPKKEA